VILDARPVNVVAHTGVKMGAYTVSQVFVAELDEEMLVEAFVLVLRKGAPEDGRSCTGGDTHHVI
jgi:hypothetical protein